MVFRVSRDTIAMTQESWSGIAQAILDGFDRHYKQFRKYSRTGKTFFERADWKGAADASFERIQGYESRVSETVAAIQECYGNIARQSDSWPRIKIAFTGKLLNHWQAECAETFYNSVACRVLHRNYYNSEYIFWRPAISTEYLEGSRPVYRSFYPGSSALRPSLLEILTGFDLDVPFKNLRRELR